MKRVLTLISIIFCFALLFSCQQAPMLSVSGPRSYTFTRDGGTQSFTFTCDRDWRVSTSDSWISVSPSSGSASDGETTVNIKCNPNTSYDSRTATLTITAEELTETITVNQDTGVGLIASPTTFELTNDEQTIEIEVRKNVQYSVAIDNESAAWIKPGGTKALTSDNITFTISANTSYDGREGKIVFKQLDGDLSETVIIKQAHGEGLIVEITDYDLSFEAQTIEVQVKNNVSFSVFIPENAKDWITLVSSTQTKALVNDRVVFAIARNSTSSNREASITIEQTDGPLAATVTVKQAFDSERVQEREALVAFYTALGGDSWINNNNWLSDRPVGEWDGIMTNANGYVTRISFCNNNLSGELPDVFSSFKHLEEFCIMNESGVRGIFPQSFWGVQTLKRIVLEECGISGRIPESISYLTSLEYLRLRRTNISGSIPSAICLLSELRYLQLANCNLWGPIPENIGNLNKLEYLDLSFNMLSGSLPKSILKLNTLSILKLQSNRLSGTLDSNITKASFWDKSWGFILLDNMFDFGNIHFTAPSFNVTDIFGNTLDSSKEYSANAYTVMCKYDTDDTDDTLNHPIIAISEACKKYDNVELIVWFSGTSSYHTNESVRQFISSYSLDCKAFVSSFDNTFDICEDESFYNGPYGEGANYPANAAPFLYIVDNQGKIVWIGSDLTHVTMEFPGVLAEKITGEITVPTIYTSTDYSQDGVVKQLQKASVGAGINIILMGDGFSDRQISNHTYDNCMNKAMEAFFSVEPYTTYREMFNVFEVVAVSENEGVSTPESSVKTALNTYQDGIRISGDSRSCFYYAINAISENIDFMEHSLVIVIVNSNQYGGTAYLYNPVVLGEDFGPGAAIAYCPLDEDFERVLHHEACGHGFGKLVDEYYYVGTSPTASDITKYKNATKYYGWWKNLDFTSDKIMVLWSKFLWDSRYANEDIGVFEGGYFEHGAYKPSENSIMRFISTDYFNAPSREAIWYRIHKLAYGKQWEYAFEDFVAYDIKNLKPSSAAQRRKESSNIIPLPPLPPPVVIEHSWREEWNNLHDNR